MTHTGSGINVQYKSLTCQGRNQNDNNMISYSLVLESMVAQFVTMYSL